jgi:hypothetical protein
MMNIVKTDIKNMQDIAPLIDDDIIEIYNGKYRRYKRVKKPNFVNGLTEVKINPYNNEREYEFASRHGSREASPNNATRHDDGDHDHDHDHDHDDHDGHDGHDGHGGHGDHGDHGGNSADNVNRITDIIRQSSQAPPSQAPPSQAPPSQPRYSQEMTHNKSIEPMVIQMAEPNQIRSTPSLSTSTPIAAAPIQDTAVLLQMLQQLQAQAQSQSQSQAQSQAQAQAQSQSPAQAPISPSTSVRSDSSIHLGEIRTDSNGANIVNI